MRAATAQPVLCLAAQRRPALLLPVPPSALLWVCPCRGKARGPLDPSCSLCGARGLGVCVHCPSKFDSGQVSFFDRKTLTRSSFHFRFTSQTQESWRGGREAGAGARGGWGDKMWRAREGCRARARGEQCEPSAPPRPRASHGTASLSLNFCALDKLGSHPCVWSGREACPNSKHNCVNRRLTPT